MRLRLPAVALTAAAVLLLLPAAQAADADHEGWFIALDVALTQPNSLDQQSGITVDETGPFDVLERHVIDNDDDATFQLGIGYSWGTMGSLRVSYWEYDNDDETSGSIAYRYFIPTVAGFVDVYYGYPGDTFEGISNIEATVLDVDYVRGVPIGDKFTLEWLAGMRVTSYEEEQTVTATASYYYTYVTEEAKRIESDAVGLRVGATGRFAFTDSFSIESGLSVSLMQADTDGESIGAILAPPSAVNIEGAATADDDNIRGQIQEYHVKFVWATGPVDWYLGYRTANWDGLVADPLPVTFGRSDRDSISFNSVSAGINLRFGGS